MNRALLAGLATLGLVASSFSHAQAFNPFGYAGVSGGQSKFRTDCAATNVFSCDQRDTGWKVYTGARISEIFGAEIGYTDFGTINANGGDTKAWAVPITLTAGIPLGDRFAIFAKGGGLFGRTDIDASPATLVDTGHKNGWGWTYGAGASMKVAQHWDIRVDWDRYQLDFVGGSKDVDMATAGVQFRF